QPRAAGREQVATGGEHFGEARVGARGDALERPLHALDALFGDADLRQRQPPHRFTQEARLLSVRIDEQELAIRRLYLTRRDVQTRTAAEIRKRRSRYVWRDRERVEHVFRHHLGGIAHRRQVVGPIPAREQIEVVEQALDRRRVERD